ncbi:hypothetical protein EVAR_94569_1 [Eumeta japonica]|uniref:Uncharacterized protein n=1 Tax=Eumeta variegata TaxID=151549 RepID=A0A4C1UUY9_EUMVA|nr:hypothetical protein EVAR_94569_1 [Eumeta japonica]
MQGLKPGSGRALSAGAAATCDCARAGPHDCASVDKRRSTVKPSITRARRAGGGRRAAAAGGERRGGRVGL